MTIVQAKGSMCDLYTEISEKEELQLLQEFSTALSKKKIHWGFHDLSSPIDHTVSHGFRIQTRYQNSIYTATSS